MYSTGAYSSGSRSTALNGSSEADGKLVDEALQALADAVAQRREHHNQDDHEDGGDEQVAEHARPLGQIAAGGRAAARMAGRPGGVEIGRHTGSEGLSIPASVDGRGGGVLAGAGDGYRPERRNRGSRAQ